MSYMGMLYYLVYGLYVWIILSGLAAYLKNLERPKITFWNITKKKPYPISCRRRHIHILYTTHTRTESAFNIS